MREGVLTRPSHRTWQRDAALGANTLTIANGHTIDAMRFVAGDFRSLSAVVATQAKQWLDTGTNTWLDVTAPDNILVSGWLKNGAVVSSHVAAIPYAGSGYRMEIYGRDGTLVASGEDSPQLSKVFLHGAQRGNKLRTDAGAGALHRRRAGHPGRRAAQCRPDVRAVRPRDPRRATPLCRISRPRSICTGWSMRSSRRRTPGGRSISTEPTRFLRRYPHPNPPPQAGEGASTQTAVGGLRVPIQFRPPCLQISLPRLRGRAGWGYSACNSAKPNQPRAARIAAHTRSGVVGMSICVTPSGASASITALTTAGSAPTVPASPAPLAPKRVELGRARVALDLHERHVVGARHRVIHEAAAQQLARLRGRRRPAP